MLSVLTWNATGSSDGLSLLWTLQSSTYSPLFFTRPSLQFRRRTSRTFPSCCVRGGTTLIPAKVLIFAECGVLGGRWSMRSYMRTLLEEMTFGSRSRSRLGYRQRPPFKSVSRG